MEKFFLKDHVMGPYSGIHYGRPGDEVIIVSDHTDMVIAECAGRRFPVKKELLTSEKVIVIKDKPVSDPVPTKRKPTKKKSLTNKLF